MVGTFAGEGDFAGFDGEACVRVNSRVFLPRNYTERSVCVVCREDAVGRGRLASWFGDAVRLG